MSSLKRKRIERPERDDTTKPMKTKPLTPRSESPPAKKISAPSPSRADSNGHTKEVIGSTTEMEGDEPAQAGKDFSDLGIIDPLCDACKELGFKKATPIQAESIPLALEGRDIIGLAETGSGKTAAFALPILQVLMDKPQALFALVLAPTRELAYQTAAQFDALGSLIKVRSAVIVGGMNMVDQAIALSKNPHIVVATPGRLLDHLENTKGFSLRNLKYLVMDEADRLLDLDFGPILDKILRVLPREGRKTYLFSATMSSKVEALQRASLSNPIRVSVSSTNSLGDNGSSGRQTTVKTLLQSFIFVPHKHKDLYLLALLSGPFAGHSAILFSRTVHETARLTYLLRALGLGAIPLHGQLSQSSRLSALNKFKAHSRDILVATDVAARGLDIPSVDLVLNYDLPGDSVTYVHRVGRTARAGKSGQAISLVTQYDVEVWLRIERALGTKDEPLKVEQYKGVQKDEVMMLAEGVSDAQRVAIKQLRDEQAKKGAGMRKKKGGRREEMDKDEG